MEKSPQMQEAPTNNIITSPPKEPKIKKIILPKMEESVPKPKKTTSDKYREPVE
jgi:hypothetical protein